MRESFKKWVNDHYVNGPSSIAYSITKKEYVQLFYSEKDDIWLNVSTLASLEESQSMVGTYFILFKYELNEFLSKKFQNH